MLIKVVKAMHEGSLCNSPFVLHVQNFSEISVQWFTLYIQLNST